MRLSESRLRVRRRARILSERASPDGLALLRGEEGGKTLLVLYDPRKLLEIPVGSQRVTSMLDPTGFGALREFGHSGVIRGYIAIGPVPGEHGPCLGSWMVHFSAADKGFGPVMYDMAMAEAGRAGARLVSDRENVSPSAANVWTFYRDRRGDVDSVPLDDVSDPQTPDPSDDCRLHDPEGDSALDLAFGGGVGAAQSDALSAASERAVEEVAERVGTSSSQIESLLLQFAKSVFLKRYES